MTDDQIEAMLQDDDSSEDEQESGPKPPTAKSWFQGEMKCTFKSTTDSKQI